VLIRINAAVKDFNPRFVFLDSFRSIVVGSNAMQKREADLWQFVHNLGQQMVHWKATTFLVGEYFVNDQFLTPVMSVADGVIMLTQHLQRNSILRKMQVVKMRGQAHSLGLHTFRISASGLTIFPRAMSSLEGAGTNGQLGDVASKRLSMGVPELDQMLGGGLPSGHSLLLVGSSGSGKTVLSTRFIAEGVSRGEPGIIVTFEKSPRQFLSQKFQDLLKSGKFAMLETSNLDLSIDEIMYDLKALIKKLGAKRVVIDSLSGFELALAPEFREDFRISLYRLTSVLSAMGVTIVMTAELEDRYIDLRFSAYGNAFLADAIMLQRYIQIEGEFKRAISVIKVRGSAHSKEIRLFDIVGDDIVLGESLSNYEGIFSGSPIFQGQKQAFEGRS